jgi:hypothetical protein
VQRITDEWTVEETSVETPAGTFQVWLYTRNFEVNGASRRPCRVPVPPSRSDRPHLLDHRRRKVGLETPVRKDVRGDRRRRGELGVRECHHATGGATMPVSSTTQPINSKSITRWQLKPMVRSLFGIHPR